VFSGLRRTVGERPVVGLAVAVAAVSTSAPLVEVSGPPSTVKAFYRALFVTAIVAPVALRRNPGDFATVTTRDLAIVVVAGVALAGIGVTVWARERSDDPSAGNSPVEDVDAPTD